MYQTKLILIFWIYCLMTGKRAIEVQLTSVKVSRITLQTSNWGLNGPPSKRLQSAAAFIKWWAGWSTTMKSKQIQKPIQEANTNSWYFLIVYKYLTKGNSLSNYLSKFFFIHYFENDNVDKHSNAQKILKGKFCNKIQRI